MKKITIILVLSLLCILLYYAIMEQNQSRIKEAGTIILKINYKNDVYTINSPNSNKILKILESLSYSMNQSDNLPDCTITTDSGELYLLNTSLKCVLHNGRQANITSTDLNTIIETIK